MIEHEITNSQTKYKLRESLHIHETQMPEAEAKFAMALIERWGLVAAMPDGEDSTGRSRLRLSTPDELVDRAFTVARLAFAHAHEDGLIRTLPSIDEIKDQLSKDE